LTTASGLAGILTGMAVVAVLNACTIRYGSLPRTDKLESLTVGASAKADVLQLLGQPRGYGMARLAVAVKPRSIWSYEYAEAEGKKITMKMLLVFFDEERYDGHLWFGASTLVDRKE
jgi:hypothetical protein